MEQGWNEVKLQAINNIFGSLETQSQKKNMTILQTPVSLQKRQSHKYIYIYMSIIQTTVSQQNTKIEKV